MEKFEVQMSHRSLNRAERVRMGLRLKKGWKGMPKVDAADAFNCSEGTIRNYILYADLFLESLGQARAAGISDEELERRISAIGMTRIRAELAAFRNGGSVRSIGTSLAEVERANPN